MSEQNQSKKENVISERPSKFSRLIYVFLFLLVVSLVITRIFIYKTPQEQLAAIEKSMAIPDSENAAIIYNQLFEDYNESDLKPALLTQNTDDFTKSSPWSSQDYPELASWYKQNENIIKKTLELSKYEKCNFHIPALSEFSSRDTMLTPGDNLDWDFLAFVKQLAFFLTRSANNDLAEKRFDEAFEKYICVLKMGNHFRTQPMMTYFLIGIALEGIGSQRIKYLILEDNTKEEQLKIIETVFNHMPTSFEKETMNINKVERLWERMSSSDKSLREKIIIRWRYKKPMKQSIKEIYLRFSTNYHGTLIFITLKRYKIKTGQWPKTLEEIKPLLSSKDILIDPLSKGSFVYKTKDDSFILYV